MPEKSSAVATYAISASIAALVLGYVFGPSIFPDDGFLSQSGNQKRFAVGLSNPANDCFINSILQALAGLKTLRSYLAHVKSQRTPDDDTTVLASRALKDKLVSLALKAKLDELNATTASKKTISAADFIKALEFAFGTSLSRRQQDAQEFLQVVAQRLEEEFHAPSRSSGGSEEDEVTDQKAPTEKNNDPEDQAIVGIQAGEESKPKAFPLEGTVESQIECLRCQYMPKPTVSTFVILTLNVPQKNSTSIDECLDGLFKREIIDGFKCERCQVEHALQSKERQLATLPSTSHDFLQLQVQIETLRQAYQDPEKLAEGVAISESNRIPKQRISKSARISGYPSALALHLSRSIFNASTYSMKNAAKVEFPETLALGFPQSKKYRLACVVTHRGGHNSGHYETFRRQFDDDDDEGNAQEASIDADPDGNAAASTEDKVSTDKVWKQKAKAQARRRSKWWCISDANIRQCSTADVLRMHKEVYLLFYELQQSASTDREEKAGLIGGFA